MTKEFSNAWARHEAEHPEDEEEMDVQHGEGGSKEEDEQPAKKKSRKSESGKEYERQQRSVQKWKKKRQGTPEWWLERNMHLLSGAEQQNGDYVESFKRLEWPKGDIPVRITVTTERGRQQVLQLLASAVHKKRKIDIPAEVTVESQRAPQPVIHQNGQGSGL